MSKIKFYKPTKALKNSKEVLEFFESKKVIDGLIPYKNGTGLVINRRVKEIYVGNSALTNATKNATKKRLHL